MARISCRDHGGTFERAPQRGRPPVRCNDDNPCSALTGNRKVPAQKGSPAAKRKPRAGKPEPVEAAMARARRAEPLPASLTPRRTRPVLPTADEVRNVSAKHAAAMVKPAQASVEPPTAPDASLAKALAAKSLLEPQGWTCHAKRGESGGVEFHASRGTERIAMLIIDGAVVSQDYSLWDTEKPSTNMIPRGARKLPFNPDELTDAELAGMLKERKVIWWNRISGKEESATCPGRVSITHSFNGTDDELPADRVITFIDMHGSGFRTFRQGALMRLDK